MTKDSKNIKAMADLLRQGATLTEHSCPACASPLFKLRSGNLWCASCQKRVMIVREGEPEPEGDKFSSLESTILVKIQAIEKQLAEETDAEKLNSLGATLSTLLENLERIRKMKKSS
ncbi:MAG: Sjogren's syndrome/scleroderma autoantigen 1 family protein [Candidatus Bathyarchaeota archaeon]